MTEVLDLTPPCSFCGARLSDGLHLPDIEVAACQGCCERLARLLVAADHGLIHTLWDLPEPGAVREVGDPADVLAEFRRGVQETVDSNDAETHFDLAVAYLEMGLAPDAFASAARALSSLPRALGLILHPKLARPGLVHRLRELLYPA